MLTPGRNSFIVGVALNVPAALALLFLLLAALTRGTTAHPVVRGLVIGAIVLACGAAMVLGAVVEVGAILAQTTPGNAPAFDYWFDSMLLLIVAVLIVPRRLPMAVPFVNVATQSILPPPPLSAADADVEVGSREHP
jgi:hypothetical protein